MRGLHSLQQFAGVHLHAVEGEPLFAKVFDAGGFGYGLGVAKSIYRKSSKLCNIGSNS